MVEVIRGSTGRSLEHLLTSVDWDSPEESNLAHL